MNTNLNLQAIIGSLIVAGVLGAFVFFSPGANAWDRDNNILFQESVIGNHQNVT